MHRPVQVSRLVNRICVGKQQPAAPRPLAAVQMAFFLPVQPGSSLSASITVTPAKPLAISAVRSVE